MRFLKILRKKIATAISLLGRPESVVGCFIVVGAPAGKLAAAPERTDLEFRKLTDDEASHLRSFSEGFALAIDALRAIGFNGAYGVFCDGRLAHVTLMMPAEVTQGLRLLDLEPGQAELGASITLPEFRGRGIFPFAAAKLFEIAPQHGIKAIRGVILMTNRSSLRVTEKLGLPRLGYAVRIALPDWLGGFRRVYRNYR